VNKKEGKEYVVTDSRQETHKRPTGWKELCWQLKLLKISFFPKE